MWNTAKSVEKPGTTAGLNWVETNLKKIIEYDEVDTDKIILGIPFYTRQWTVTADGQIKDRTVVSMMNIKIPNNVESTIKYVPGKISTTIATYTIPENKIIILDLPEKAIEKITVNDKEEYQKFQNFKKESGYINETKILSTHMPFENLFSVFRCSGRFIWIIAYSLFIIIFYFIY